MCVRSSSDLSPDSRVIEGLIGTGGTARTVKIMCSGLVIFGLNPKQSKSESGTFSRRERTSLGVSLRPSSRKVVGLSKVTLIFASPQCGHVFDFTASRTALLDIPPIETVVPASESIKA